MADIATQAILGVSLPAQNIHLGLLPEEKQYAVKMPVFSFGKLRKVDIALGPEMKSTGEVIGRDGSLNKALYKAMIAAGYEMRAYGKVLFTIGDRDKVEALSLARRFSEIGYGLVATEGTRRFLEEHGLVAQGVEKIGAGEETVLDAIRGRKVQFVVNTFSVAKRISSPTDSSSEESPWKATSPASRRWIRQRPY